MLQGEYFWSPPEIIGVVFAYTFFYTIEKVVLYRQLTKPKVVSLTRPALLKHSRARRTMLATYEVSGHWYQASRFLVCKIGLNISKRRVATLLHTTVKNYKVEGGTSQVRLKRGYAQKSDNREKQSQTLFSISSTRLHEVSSH